MEKTIKCRAVMLMLAIIACTLAKAGNTTRSVSQVTGPTTLHGAVDYTISGIKPFTSSAYINIANEDAVVIFSSIKPSEVINTWLYYVQINGEAAVNNSNARVAIHGNGSIVYPHANTSYHPLTVFTEASYGGDSTSNYLPKVKNTSLGKFDNAIRSFKLKRGYMVTLATSSDGTGYSRVFIAQDEDLEVSELSKYLKDKVSFIRIFPWQKLTKKGYAGDDTNALKALGVTWFYNWSASDYNYNDYEYVAMHHHEGWPSYSTINSLQNGNTVLGNNEPDNSGDDKEQYIEPSKIVSTFSETWGEIYKSGRRVGSPAMASNITGWLVPFVNFCDKYNYRLDFIATHCYWYNTGSYYNTQMNYYYNLFKRPIWVTEFNYGANWTSWVRDDTSNSSANQQSEKSGLSSIVNALESNSYVERYAVYNWVQACRYLYYYNDGSLVTTLAGDWYGSLKSNTAYTNVANYVPSWNYSSPTDLTITYNKNTKRAELSWTNSNGEQTDSVYIERLESGNRDYSVVGKIYDTESTDCVYRYDTLTNVSGIITYRVHNFDSDGKERYSGTATLTIGASQGNGDIQYGTLTVSNTDEISTDFSTPFEATPAVFMGIPTNNNPQAGLCNLVSTTTSKSFTFKFSPWQKSGNSTLSSNEEIGFIAMPFGVHNYGDTKVVVDQVKVSGDTTEVTFSEPFPEGVVPVVVTELKPTLKTYPIMTKIWDITNEGFKCRIMYEAGINTTIRTKQNLSYIAMPSGTADAGNGLLLTAGIGNAKLFGNTYKVENLYTTDADGTETEQKLYNPVFIGNTQDHICNAGNVLRKISEVTSTEKSGLETLEYVTGLRIKRQVDGSTDVTTSTSTSGETFGWIAVSEDPDYDATSIKEIVLADGNATLNVAVVNRIIFVEGHDTFEVYNANGTKVAANATQTPGIYIVRCGGQTKKVVVR